MRESLFLFLRRALSPIPVSGSNRMANLKKGLHDKAAALQHRRQRFLVLVVLTIWNSTSVYGREHLSEWLDLPPAMLRLIGDPEVKIHTGTPLPGRADNCCTGGSRIVMKTIGNGASKIRVIRLSGSTGSAKISLKDELAKSVLDHFWRTQFQRDSFELIAINRKRFLRIGHGQLLGRPVSNDAEGNAWWRVRMGYPLAESSRYHLITMVIRFDVGNTPYGHFALGVRQNGGNSLTDFVIDPRAPWNHHESPSIGDWIMPSPELINGLHVSNLYDWLYTQTNYRGMKADMEFFPLAREQVVLLKNLPKRSGPGNYGRFGTLRNNCATIGHEIIEALMPVDKTLSIRHPIADMPARVAKKTRKRFAMAAEVELRIPHDENSREPTANWSIHRPQNRKTTAEFKRLFQVPEIN